MTKYNLLDQFTLRDPATRLEQQVFITVITLNPTPAHPEDKIIYTFSNLQVCNEPSLIYQIEQGLIKREDGINEDIIYLWNNINHS